MTAFTNLADTGFFIRLLDCSFKGFRIFRKFNRIVQKQPPEVFPLHKKWSFPLRISSVNVTESAGNCGISHIYWGNLQWKTSFFVQCPLKKVLLEISQNSHDNICTSASFFNNVAGLRPATLFKKRLWHRCFHVNFWNF